jgi:hypothetical protein
MTEYDYSPEARNKFVEKMNSVARWRDNTNGITLRDPFVKTPAPARSPPLPSSGREGRPAPKRSQTMPNHPRSRSLDVHRQNSYNSGSQSRHKSKSSHTSSKHDRKRSQTMTMAMQQPAPPMPTTQRAQTMPQQPTQGGQAAYVMYNGQPMYVQNGAYYPSRPGYTVSRSLRMLCCIRI